MQTRSRHLTIHNIWPI